MIARQSAVDDGLLEGWIEGTACALRHEDEWVTCWAVVLAMCFPQLASFCVRAACDDQPATCGA